MTAEIGDVRELNAFQEPAGAPNCARSRQVIDDPALSIETMRKISCIADI
jgi:hypothetical protein